MSKNKSGLTQKIQWVIDNYYNKGKSRPEAVQGLIDKFNCKRGYARTIVYNHLCYLEWKRAPYPKNRKSRNSEKKEQEKKELLAEKFKAETLEIDESAEIPTNFDF